MATTYEPIATTTLGSATTTITFSSISSAYTDLRLVLAAKTATTSGYWFLKYNNDSSALYSTTRINGDGSTISSGRTTSSANGIYAGFNTGTTYPYLTTVDIFSYAGSTNKTCLTFTASDANGSGQSMLIVGMWGSTAAINRLDIIAPGSGNWNTGTIATLYGIKAA